MKLIDLLQHIQKKEIADRLYHILSRGQSISSEEAETVVHALVDIAESVEAIYAKILPELLEKDLSDEELLDRVWEIREELRHIDYHIHDSSLFLPLDEETI